MAHSFSRQELYKLVWSKPIKELAADFGISDVGLAKACRAADIPTPERGYWARKKAGKCTFIRPLPPRFPGASNTIALGPNRGGYWQDNSDLEDPIQPAPTFDEDMEVVAKRVQKMVGRVSCPKGFENCHKLVAVLLERDEKWRAEYLQTGYSWKAPKYDSPSEKRRLRILNAIFLAAQRVGGKPSMRTSQYDPNPNQASIDGVSFTLGPETFKKAAVAKTSANLTLAIHGHWQDKSIIKSWTDADGVPLEKLLDEIVAEIFVASETIYRRSAVIHHEWLVQRREELKAELLRQQKEAERKARELKAKEEKDRIDQLLAQAQALHQSMTIRSYVEAVLARSSDVVSSAMHLENWAEWALAEADRIDPVKNGMVIESVRRVSNCLE